MVNELKPVTRSQLIDRIRFGERYLRYNLDDIVHTKSFSALREIKRTLDQRRSSEKAQESGKDDVEEDAGGSSYGKAQCFAKYPARY